MKPTQYEYFESRTLGELPRLPLHGSLDLTYSCNNNCRHCWLRLAPAASERQQELTLDEIVDIFGQARKMGCRQWSISGGEPMLRPDFADIFEYIASRSLSYTLNSNGSLITPRIAKLMIRKGIKLISLYGATAEVHDHITRNPGSFDATMQGFAYLKEAGAGFTVQLVPMQDNFHQLNDMIALAESLSPYWRWGASWLYLTADGDPEKNKEIMRQRLNPKDVSEIDRIHSSDDECINKDEGHRYLDAENTEYPLAPCISARREFHIDPYGQMSFCHFIKDLSLRCDLRKANFQECWEEFIPALADSVRGGKEYLDNCGSCEQKKYCYWCPVYGYLEHRSYSSKVAYLCEIARENLKFSEEWRENHRRYFNIAGITIQVEADCPIKETTFHSKFKHFQVDVPGEDTVVVRHHFRLPKLEGVDLGESVYHKPPWAIYRRGNSWVYTGISNKYPKRIHRVAVFNHDHTMARIYSETDRGFCKGGLTSLTGFPTDQILLARILADRDGCFLHASGLILDGKGLLFVGHSDAGKTTMVRMLEDKAHILCDDRIIVRKHEGEFRIYGTWSHGDVAEVSAESAPLTAILFLEKADRNHLISIKEPQESIRYLLACLIKPLTTTDWWEKVLSLVEEIASEIPCYSLQFDTSGRVVDVLRRL